MKKEDRYSQQSPFIFNLYQGLIQFLKENKRGDAQIEVFRNSLLSDTSKIEVLDLGAGSKKLPNRIRTVSEITRYSTSGTKFSQLYQYFCSQTPAKHVIELGTCVGISTRYLSKATKGKLFTFEGSDAIQKIAQRKPLPGQTEFVLGPITKTLPSILNLIPEVDFALIDANHTYEGTVFAYESLATKAHSGSILAIGDIHWNPGMKRAWKEIQTKKEVKLTLDFFECGIVFFDFPGEKTNLVLHI